MRWFAVLALLLVLPGFSRAAGPDDLYLDIYNEILQADSLQQSGHSAAAEAKYIDAQTALKRLKDDHPTWNTAIVSFRLDYLADQIQALAKALPATNAPPPQAVVPIQPAPSAQLAAETAGLQEQVRSLTAANVALENKLKEALSVQPAAVSPRELAKAEEKMLALQKEKDLLSVALAQAKAAKTPIAPPPEADKTANQLADANQALADLKARSAEDAKAAQTELAQIKSSLADSQQKIATYSAEIDSLKLDLAQAAKTPIAPPAEVEKTANQLADANQALADLKARSGEDAKVAQTELAQLKTSLADSQQKIAAAAAEIDSLKSARPPEDSREIAAERDQLKEELAARTRDLADAEAHRDSSAPELRAQLAEAERQRDELKAKYAAAETARAGAEASPSSAPAPATSEAQVDQLRARLAVLEAKAVPYTPEELAMMKQIPSRAAAQGLATPPGQGPATPAERKHIIHSMKDLPPGAGALMTEAARDTMERDYAKAAEKYEEILHQDENNVYVLAYLANAQFALGQLAECEKTALHALALDPEDPASLYILGILRFRQDKLDEALDELSRSAKYSPTNAGTQFYLGSVLAAKGMRYAAETAFRKALESDPNYADANYSLACVYAVEKPPSLELARWHYHRALDLGHDKNPELEKLLAPSP